MENILLTLENLFIYNPNKLPIDHKADEQAQIDAKIIFFYPTLVEQHNQRAFIMIAESIVLVFNRFSVNELDEITEIGKTNILHLDKKVLISQKIDDDHFLVILFSHENPSNQNNQMNEKYDILDSKILSQISQNFIHTFTNIFGNIGLQISNSIKIVSFIETIVHFIELYFKRNGTDFSNHPFNLLPNFLYRRKIDNKVLLNLVKLSTILKINHEELIDLIIFKNAYLMYSSFDPIFVAEIANLLFDFLDFEKFENPNGGLAKNFEMSDDYNYRTFEGNRNGIIIGSQLQNQPKIYSKNALFEAKNKYYTVLNINGAILFYVFSKKLSTSSIFLDTQKFLKDQVIFDSEPEIILKKNKYVFFYNCINFSFSNSVDLVCIEKMSKQLASYFMENFQKLRNGNLKSIFLSFLKIKNEACLINFVNDRILVLYTVEADQLDLWKEFHELSKKIESIIL